MPLLLDLLRHGDALRAPDGGHDAERALSPAGRDTIARLATHLRAERFSPDRILASPYRRARESAELLRAGTGAHAAIDIAEALTPDRDPEEVLTDLAAPGVTIWHVVLVSHQPLVGRIASYLTGTEPEFSAGTLVRIELHGEIARGAGRLVRVIHPRDLI